MLAVWTMALTGAVALAYAWLEKRLAAPGCVVPVARQCPRGATQWLAVAAALFVLFMVCAAPLLAIAGRAAHALLWGQGADVLHSADTLDALWNTLRFSGMALALATLLGITHALAVRALDVAGALRSGGPASRGMALLWRTAAFLPFAGGSSSRILERSPSAAKLLVVRTFCMV